MLQPGVTLSRGYVIEKVLGQGGMGAVYLARQSTLGNRRVAIKETTLPVHDPDLVSQIHEQFQREATILASIDHPNLVDVKEYFEESGSHYLVMAYIDGETLEQMLQRLSQPPPIEQSLAWMDPLCDILSLLHEHEPPVIVRDLKPSNVMIDTTGRLRLIDFGIARVQTAQDARTSNLLKGAGSVGYAPTEQFGGQGTDARSDIYALGATLYALLTRTVPPWSVHLAAGETVLRPPSALNPAVPAALDAVVMRMMALRRDARPATVREVRTALASVRDALRPASAPAGVARFCMHCGAVIVAGTHACTQCGNDLTQQAAQMAAAASGGHRAEVPPVAPPSGTGSTSGAWSAPSGASISGGGAWSAPSGASPTSDGKTPPWNAPRPAPVSPALMLVIALAACAGLWLWKRGPSPPPVARASTASAPYVSASPTPSPSPSAVAAATPEPPVEAEEGTRGCLANLKRLSDGLELYATDNEGHYPSQLAALSPAYVDVLPSCPASRSTTYQINRAQDGESCTVFCVGWNHKAAGLARDFPRADRKGPQLRDPILDKQPSDAKGWFDRGLAWLNQGEYARAISDLQTASRLAPDWADPLYVVGLCKFEQGDSIAAVASYTEAIEMQKQAPYFVERAKAYEAMFEYEKALADLVEADKLEKNNLDTYGRVAFTLYKMGRFKQAMEVCALLLKQDLQNADAYVARYWCEICLGQGAAAASDAQSYLTHLGWSAEQSAYSVIIGALGYEMDKRASESQGLLDSGLARLRHDWPYPCVQYLAGKIDQGTLLGAATDVEKKTEAWFYVGLRAANEGRKDDARTAFTWVRDNGYKPFLEYRAVLTWLGRL